MWVTFFLGHPHSQQSTMPAKEGQRDMVEQITRLATLMKRGRILHFENLRKLAGVMLKRRMPTSPSPQVELVYAAIQTVIAKRFIERRRYLPAAQLDYFCGELVRMMAGENNARLQNLIQIYASHFDHETQFVACISNDICHVLLNETHPELLHILQTTPRAMLKTTHLYCAMTFGDTQIVHQLS